MTTLTDAFYIQRLRAAVHRVAAIPVLAVSCGAGEPGPAHAGSAVHQDVVEASGSAAETSVDPLATPFRAPADRDARAGAGRVVIGEGFPTPGVPGMVVSSMSEFVQLPDGEVAVVGMYSDPNSKARGRGAVHSALWIRRASGAVEPVFLPHRDHGIAQGVLNVVGVEGTGAILVQLRLTGGGDSLWRVGVERTENLGVDPALLPCAVALSVPGELLLRANGGLYVRVTDEGTEWRTTIRGTAVPGFSNVSAGSQFHLISSATNYAVVQTDLVGSGVQGLKAYWLLGSDGPRMVVRTGMDVLDLGTVKHVLGIHVSRGGRVLVATELDDGATAVLAWAEGRFEALPALDPDPYTAKTCAKLLRPVGSDRSAYHAYGRLVVGAEVQDHRAHYAHAGSSPDRVDWSVDGLSTAYQCRSTNGKESLVAGHSRAPRVALCLGDTVSFDGAVEREVESFAHHPWFAVVGDEVFVAVDLAAVPGVSDRAEAIVSVPLVPEQSSIEAGETTELPTPGSAGSR